MAVSLTSTYAGEFAGKYISAALLSGSTLENGLVTVLPKREVQASASNRFFR